MLASLLLLASSIAASAAPVPPAPQHYVLDEPGLLAPKQIQALGALLIEHHHATNEQIMIAVLKKLGAAENGANDPAGARANEVFRAWGISERGGGNGGLLAVFYDEREARIEAGYGLSTRLTDAAARSVIEEYLLPELRAGEPYRALGLSALEILRAVGSPLIESGRARDILRLGGLEGSLATATPREFTLWFVWVLAGLGLFVAVVPQLLAAEAHFTSGGWFRPRPWKQAFHRVTDSLRERRAGRPESRSSVGGADARW